MRISTMNITVEESIAESRKENEITAINIEYYKEDKY